MLASDHETRFVRQDIHVSASAHNLKSMGLENLRIADGFTMPQDYGEQNCPYGHYRAARL